MKLRALHNELNGLLLHFSPNLIISYDDKHYHSKIRNVWAASRILPLKTCASALLLYYSTWGDLHTDVIPEILAHYDDGGGKYIVFNPSRLAT